MARAERVLEIGVAEFKAKCTTIMPMVKRTGRIVRVMRHGEPLVELHPPAARAPEPFVGRLAGTVTRMGDLVRPLGEPWSAVEDDG